MSAPLVLNDALRRLMLRGKAAIAATRSRDSTVGTCLVGAHSRARVRDGNDEKGHLFAI